MILFHGTYLDFDRIDLSKSNKGKDFGKGFYLSENKEQAENILRSGLISFWETELQSSVELL